MITLKMGVRGWGKERESEILAYISIDVNLLKSWQLNFYNVLKKNSN